MHCKRVLITKERSRHWAIHFLTSMHVDLQTPSSSFFAYHETPRIDSDALCAVICFVYPNQSIGQLKHIVPKAVQDKAYNVIYTDRLKFK